MFGPWLVIFGWLKQHIPMRWSAFKPRLNFITIHYMYIVSMALIGSVILYPAKDMAYIDALFFASGGATQSGLNTIDLNRLRLYQQVVLMLLASVCNPIFINTFVVFIRLYWFERRFQNVVLEARSMRRSRTRSVAKSEGKPDLERDIGREENGVGNREIRVLRAADGHVKGTRIDDEEAFHEGDIAIEDSDDESGSASTPRKEKEPAPGDASPKTDYSEMVLHRNITFADEVTNPQERLPQKNKETSIAFVENQRNPKDATTFRIPGPRDYDLGFVPERIEEGTELDRPMTNTSHDGDCGERLQAKRSRSASRPPAQEMNGDDHPFKTHITIDVPDVRRRPNAGPSAYNFNRTRRRSDVSEEEPPPSGLHVPNRSRSRTFSSFLTRDKEEEDPMPYLSWTPTVGRNSAFVDLTEEQREELGGIEYRALKLLAVVLVCYFVGFHLLGMICLLPWIVNDAKYSAKLRDVGVSPVWWGFFTPASMFNDLGFTLNPDSMVMFQLCVLPLLLGTFLIIIGNTGFPCMLRFIIWLASKCVPYRSGVWEEFKFLLDHPRRCFTLLFPSSANWWLFWVLILLNGIDLIFFIVLDLNAPAVEGLPGGFRFLDGLFQAASTRTAGFAVVSLSDLHPAIQVSYLIMMYISVFPIAISMRKTNVYEEKSLGIWSGDEDENTGHSYFGTHVRRQLSFDLWYVFLGFFIIAIVEGSRLQNTNEYAFTLFSVLFEIVSAYGTVGLSLGYPGTNASFSGQFKPLSKLIIIAMQIRGRHRGLPYALDRAILLPSESLHKKEDEDAMRRARRGSNVSDLGDGGLSRTGTGLSRRSTASENGGGFRGKLRPADVGRFFAGALNAGPSIPREKRA
ncbi:potassium transport protein TRK1/TRK2 [Paraphaeosphaeria sporulosa]|uniref:Potassium transport protein n=1 Tax=Paraphaeosphaeria sporulosa TaxID=1460663 RepID=A0A177CA62_9PLEO|nr:potassium transport protein TRK1/TRK2 [Paraphaeosphaeria sporulosa]OAG04634.1 potassium transport protein TRK1/TRK2 [Paraphaeosphaeria sporulosa]